jgi:hypothetical protein
VLQFQYSIWGEVFVEMEHRGDFQKLHRILEEAFGQEVEPELIVKK